MLPQVFETKEYIPSIYSNENSTHNDMSSFMEHLVTGGEMDLVSIEAIRLYTKCLPLAQGVDLRAKAFANLRIKIFDRKKNQFTDDIDHPALVLLSQPNTDQSQREFLTAYATYNDITGNSYLTINSMGEKAPPLEIHNVNPTEVAILPSTGRGTAGFAGSFTVNNPYSGQMVYNLDDTGNRFRYFTKDGDGELWHARSFNVLRNGNHLYGSSPIMPISLEVQQYIEGNATNYNSLKNGVRPSGHFTNVAERPLTKEQWVRLKEMVELYTGAKGSSRAFASDGVKFEPTQMPNRDMEFRDLQTDMFERISYRYSIPLPLMSNQSSTYNNLATALFQFYDLSVTPFADRLLEELSIFLMPRYKGSENLELRFDPAEVSALKLRAFEEGIAMRKVMVNSDNEIRTTIGYEGVGKEGDAIYKPSMLVVAGQDVDTRGNDTSPPSSSKFVEILIQSKKRGSDEYYTEAEAYKIAEEEGLIDKEESNDDLSG